MGKLCILVPQLNKTNQYDRNLRFILLYYFFLMNQVRQTTEIEYSTKLKHIELFQHTNLTLGSINECFQNIKPDASSINS